MTSLPILFKNEMKKYEKIIKTSSLTKQTKILANKAGNQNVKDFIINTYLQKNNYTYSIID